MDAGAFLPGCPGQLVAIEKGHAFVPEPLRSGVSLPPGTIKLLGRAHSAIGALLSAGKLLPNPDLFVAPFRKQEAVLSSRIEGSPLSLDDAFADEVAASRERGDDHREVVNYERALNLGLEQLASGRPLNVALIKALHIELLRSVRGEKAKPGTIKTEQNFLGYSNDIRGARFVPPPPLQTRDCLDQLDAFLQQDLSEADDPLIRAALVHYQFETIHPFNDGNGRLGRLVVILQLVAEKALDRPWLFLSPFIEKRRQDYYDLLFAVSSKGAWNDWLTFFLSAVESSATSIVTKMNRLRLICTEMEERVRQKTTSSNPLALIRLLQEYPYLTVDRAKRHLSAPLQTAANAVKTLQDLEIIVKRGQISRPGRGRNPDFYYSPELFELIDEDV